MNQREIKFRVWCKITKCFLYDKESVLGIMRMDNFENYVIQQYICDNDKSGIDIYEGDRIRSIYHPYDEFIVTWCRAGYDNNLAFHPMSKEGFHYNNFYGGWKGEEFEVIGNIFENENN